MLNRFVGGMAIVRVRSRRKEHGRTNGSLVLYMWMCGERGDDDVSALFMSVLRRCRRHTATDHSVPHEWKINKPQMGV